MPFNERLEPVGRLVVKPDLFDRRLRLDWLLTENFRREETFVVEEHDLGVFKVLYRLLLVVVALG